MQPASFVLAAVLVGCASALINDGGAYPWIPTFPDDDKTPSGRTNLLRESQADFGIGSSGAGIDIIRPPKFPHEVREYAKDRECSAIYLVTLSSEWTTQGNDKGMLPPHGKNMVEIVRENALNFRDDGNRANGNWGKDWTSYPYPKDAAKQAQAAVEFKPSALTEARATPLGFKQDVMHYGHDICLRVRGVGRRWVEIMAQSSLPDQQICVSDWKKEDLGENPVQSTCGNGAVRMCRDSALEYADTREQPDQTNQLPVQEDLQDEMLLKIHCKDSCDFDDMEMFWRITASQLKATCDGVLSADGKSCSGPWQQPDAENWCGKRDGDDFPSSLLSPYSENYVEPPVFAQVSAASSVAVSVWMLALAAILACLF
eukprot:m.146033 g.146033  ORF g.146033 m.146033 type:complete len:372 (+) comp17236_c0_seq6:229-1344(+)